MAEAVDEARKERELTKAALTADLDRLESRVRWELDWRARLRREWPRLVLAGGALVVVVAGGVALRRVLGGGRRRLSSPRRPGVRLRSLDDVIDELGRLREELDGRRGSQPVWQRALIKATTAAGAAGGSLAARELMRRYSGVEGGSETAPGEGGPSPGWE